MPSSTAVAGFGDDWRKFVGAGLALTTIFSIARKSRLTTRDVLQLAAAIGFFLD